jgi:hypothetical protein
MASHANWLTVCGCTGSYGEYVAHLIDFDIASETQAFCYQPISYLLVRTGEREAAHASAC